MREAERRELPMLERGPRLAVRWWWWMREMSGLEMVAPHKGGGLAIVASCDGGGPTMVVVVLVVGHGQTWGWSRGAWQRRGGAALGFRIGEWKHWSV